MAEAIDLYTRLADPLLEAAAIGVQERARAVVTRALDAGLGWEGGRA